jgi:regulator of sirC expression with transglutaminase-like and TPR domain
VEEAVWTTQDQARYDIFATMAADCESVSLARLVLQIAVSEFPELIVEAQLEKLKTIASEIQRRLSPGADDNETLEKAHEHLFDELRFQGDRHQYYDPTNSYLNKVLSRCMGLPILLCVAYLDIGERLGLPMEGVGLPGHFIVRYKGGIGSKERFIDPFNRGKVLDRAGCRAMVEQLTGGRLPWDDDYLCGVDNRYILTRILNNLKGAYHRLADLNRALRVQNYLVALNPDSPHEYRDRGLIYVQLESSRGALADFSHYLTLLPSAPDADVVKYQISMLKKQVSALL